MTTEEKFNQIYPIILNENIDDMEVARKEAQVEKIHNIIIIIVIILINIAFYYGMYKLTGTSSEDGYLGGDLVGFLGAILFLGSLIIYEKIKDRGGKSKIKKYTMDFKTRIVGTMIKSFEEQLEFTPKYRFIINRI